MNGQAFQEQKLVIEPISLAQKAITDTVEYMISCLYNGNTEISSKKITQFRESLSQLLDIEKDKGDVSLIQIEQNVNGTHLGKNTVKGFAELLTELSIKPEQFLPINMNRNLCLDVRADYKEGRCSRGRNYPIELIK